MSRAISHDLLWKWEMLLHLNYAETRILSAYLQSFVLAWNARTQTIEHKIAQITLRYITRLPSVVSAGPLTIAQGMILNGNLILQTNFLPCMIVIAYYLKCSIISITVKYNEKQFIVSTLMSSKFWKIVEKHNHR